MNDLPKHHGAGPRRHGAQCSCIGCIGLRPALPGCIYVGRCSWGVVKFASMTLKLRLPISSMIKRTMHLSGSNNNLQVQAALNAVTGIIKEAVWFITVYCCFTVGGVKLLQLSSVIFAGEELTKLGFVREELTKLGFVREECAQNFENDCSKGLCYSLVSNKNLIQKMALGISIQGPMTSSECKQNMYNHTPIMQTSIKKQHPNLK